MKQFDELISMIEEFNMKLNYSEAPPHSSNLLHQLKKREVNTLPFFNELCQYYFSFRDAASNYNLDIESYITNLVNMTNNYMDFFLQKNPFSHQADFTSSIIPEMFFLLMYRVVKEANLDLHVSAQAGVPIECMFDLHENGRLMYKTKRLDMLVCKKTNIILDEKSYDFVIPLIAMEMKTNLDKNMMSGIENSVTALKKTFPNCLYFVVTEFSDMALDKLNYASSDVDEIYIIRKQKRASVRSKKARRNEIDARLILELATLCHKQIISINDTMDSIDKRMKTGKLIN
ncbi:Bpu10I family restriction endonuclease [Segatella copri]|uniref:Bpu10I family restriction endonuclease n=1 Tax=Segatella copri TaxID=165179 RepID=UPI003F9493E4